MSGIDALSRGINNTRNMVCCEVFWGLHSGVVEDSKAPSTNGRTICTTRAVEKIVWPCVCVCVLVCLCNGLRKFKHVWNLSRNKIGFATFWSLYGYVSEPMCMITRSSLILLPFACSFSIRSRPEISGGNFLQLRRSLPELWKVKCDIYKNHNMKNTGCDKLVTN